MSATEETAAQQETAMEEETAAGEETAAEAKDGNGEEAATTEGATEEGGEEEEDDQEEDEDDAKVGNGDTSKTDLSAPLFDICTCISTEPTEAYNKILEDMQKVLSIPLEYEEDSTKDADIPPSFLNEEDKGKSAEKGKIPKVPLDGQLVRILKELDEKKKFHSHSKVVHKLYQVPTEMNQKYLALPYADSQAQKRIKLDQGLNANKKRLFADNSVSHHYYSLVRSEQSTRETLRILAYNTLLGQYLSKAVLEPESAKELDEDALTQAFKMLNMTNQVAFETVARSVLYTARERRKMLVSNLECPVDAKKELLQQPMEGMDIFNNKLQDILKTHGAEKPGSRKIPGLFAIRGNARFRPYPGRGDPGMGRRGVPPLLGPGPRGPPPPRFGGRGGVPPLMGPPGRGWPRGGPRGGPPGRMPFRGRFGAPY